MINFTTALNGPMLGAKKYYNSSPYILDDYKNFGTILGGGKIWDFVGRLQILGPYWEVEKFGTLLGG
jgi:hypothetical protein